MTEKSEIFIIGASGHGREVLWLLQELNAAGQRFQIAGFLDDAEDKQGQTICGVPVVGPIDALRELPGRSVALGVGLPHVKRKILSRIGDWDLSWPTLVAPGVRCSPHVELGRGATVFWGSVLTTQVRVGDFALVNLNCTLSHDVTVGQGSMISPGTHLTGNVSVGDWVSVGTGVATIPGVHVGDFAVVGAGTVLISDVAPGSTVVGNPGRVVATRDEAELA